MASLKLAQRVCRHCRSRVGSRISLAHQIRQSSHAASEPKKTVRNIDRLHQASIPITALTAHDFLSSQSAEKANVDLILVGDSLAMVALGHSDTNVITLRDMIHHSKAVRRGAPNSFVITDLPFGSYEAGPDKAQDAAVQVIKECGVDGIKLEGGRSYAPSVRRIVETGIPVLGHIGLLPQRHNALGGFRVQGNTASKALEVYEDALSLQDAGAFALVVEALPSKMAAVITEKLRIPTIGIGAGLQCSGQVLVQMDMLGMYEHLSPRFNKRFAELGAQQVQAIESYVGQVKGREFPGTQHQYNVKEEEVEKFKALIN